jgi:glycosyltransferase involved in cell wall biosynthesis
MKKKPEISVIVTVYNTEKYLPRCMDSILAQTFRDFECIMVEDYSWDSSPALCDEYAQKDNRIRVIHNKSNQGCPQSRKAGFDISLGHYILFVDSDDWIEENMLELMYRKAVGENLDMVYCGIYVNYRNRQEQFDSPILQDKTEMLKQMLTYGKFTPSLCNKLIKRDIYEIVVFPTANYAEDRPISIQTIYYSKNIGFIDDLLYHYFHNSNSICNNNSEILKRRIDDYENILWAINFLYNNLPGCLCLFEPELSSYINSLKLYFILEKSIRDPSRLHGLYPESEKNIFSNAWRESFFKKIFLKLAINDFPYIFALIDIFYAPLHLLKKTYRLIIPEKIRAFIWQKRTGVSFIDS